MRNMLWLSTKPRVAAGGSAQTPGWFSVVKAMTKSGEKGKHHVTEIAMHGTGIAVANPGSATETTRTRHAQPTVHRTLRRTEGNLSPVESRRSARACQRRKRRDADRHGRAQRRHRAGDAAARVGSALRRRR